MAKISPAWLQFEKRIEAQCLRYLRDGRAKISKVDPPTKVVGRGSGRKIIFLKNPFLDFIGVITGPRHQGLAITFEAKRTERPYLALGGRGLTLDQCSHLVAWQTAGAVTGLLWCFGADVSWIPGPAVVRWIKGTPRNLKFSEGIPIPQTPYPDFLPFLMENQDLQI